MQKLSASEVLRGTDLDYDKLVSSIYDCAVNPELWPDTLCAIRDSFDAAFVMVGLFDLEPLDRGNPAGAAYHTSPWNIEWLERVFSLLRNIPASDRYWEGVLDEGWTQMSQLSESDFHQTSFYQNWVKPQQLRDTLNLNFIRRQKTFGVITAPSFTSRELYSPLDAIQFSRLAPHIRRAITINDIVDRGKLAQVLYAKVLDSLSAAVFIVSPGRRLVFANGAGEAMLMDANFLKQTSGVLSAPRVAGAPSAFDDAIDRAMKGDSAAGISGIGVALIGNDGDRAAAYVLPISGNDLRGTLGSGHALVFVARRGEQQPVILEVLRTYFDLTPAEARTAALIAKGDSPAVIAEATSVSVHTVRTHLARCFAKTGAADQASLGALVNGLLPPVSASSIGQ